MRLRAKIGTLLFRGVTRQGRLIVGGRETTVNPDLSCQRIFFSDTLTRLERKQVFRRLIGRMELAARMYVVTGEWPSWCAGIDQGTPDAPAIAMGPEFDLSKPDPILHSPL